MIGFKRFIHYANSLAFAGHIIFLSFFALFKAVIA